MTPTKTCTTSTDSETIKKLRVRIALAKRRALYWSGIPFLAPNKVARCGNDEKYEIALDDVHSLTGQLADCTGAQPQKRRAFNPKRDFAEGWNRLKVGGLK